MVTFPNDTIVECLSRTGQGSTGVPVIEGDSCNNYGIRLVLDTETGACADGDWMIERIWRVEHNCLADSFFQQTQIIQIIDTTPRCDLV